MKNLTIFLLLVIYSASNAQDYTVQQPVKNFDALWTKFNQRYAFFEVKKVNWNGIYKKYRPLIHDNTSNDSLFTVCNMMIKELKDGHVSLTQFGKNKKIIRISEDGHHIEITKKFPITKDTTPNIYQLLDLTTSTLKKYGFSDYNKSKNKILQRSVSKDYGYLMIYSMEGYQIGEVDKFMKESINSFRDKKGVIIDIRVNGGGYAKNSDKILSTFVDKKRLAYYHRTRIKGTNNYSKLKSHFIKPSGKFQFTKPIIVLTSDLTASAAEEFTMAIKKLPYVTTVGDNTQGILSDVFEFRLPNGWKGTLSHQQYFSTDMINYEGVGIPPHFKLLNNHIDLKNGIDPLIEKALDILNSKITID